MADAFIQKDKQGFHILALITFLNKSKQILHVVQNVVYLFKLNNLKSNLKQSAVFVELPGFSVVSFLCMYVV